MMNLKNWIMIVIFIIPLILLTIVTGCSLQEEDSNGLNEIRIAEQYGLAYAPLQVVKELELIEKNLPNTVVTWKQLGNTAAIREAMLAGELDAGFMAIPPFLIGWDKGMEWKIACGLSSSPVGLVSNRDGIQTLADFQESDRIALPQPGSVQHILLSMACETEFKKASALDHLLVTMKHPDGMNALLAKREITAHFTTPPYLFEELSEGMHLVLDGKEAMGEDFTFIIGVATKQFYVQEPEVYQAFVQSLQEAIVYMQDNPQETFSLLADAYGMQAEEVARYLNEDGMDYSLDVDGVEKFADFMKRSGYIQKKPGSMNEIRWKQPGDE